jgi:tetratricopeptide (TPR) repeat protein
LAGDLDAIVLRALRKEPSARYATVDQLSDDIRRHLDGLPVMAHRDAFAYRARKLVTRHRAATATAAAAVIALIAAAVVSTWQARVAVRERDRAALEAAKAAQISAFLRDMLASADPYVEGREVTVADTLARAASRLDATLAGQPEVAASVRATIGNSYVNLGLVEEAEPLLRAALAERVRRLGPDHQDIAQSLGDLAYVLLVLEQGALDEAETRYRASLDMMGRLGRAKDAATITPLNGLGRVANARGDDAAAEGHYRAALGIARATPGGERWVAEGLNNLAVIHQSRAELAQAEALYREAVEIIRRLRGAESPELATALSNLSGVLSSRRNFAEAEPMSARALAMRRAVLGEGHPDVSVSMFNHAELLGTMGRYGESIELARQVVERRGRALPDGHPIVAAAMLVLGRSLTAAGRPSEGLPYLQQALARRQEGLPPNHWLLASTASTLGGTLTALRRYGEAESILVPSFERLRDDRGMRHERTLDALRRLIALYEAWPKPERAAHFRSLLPSAP